VSQGVIQIHIFQISFFLLLDGTNVLQFRHDAFCKCIDVNIDYLLVMGKTQNEW